MSKLNKAIKDIKHGERLGQDFLESNKFPDKGKLKNMFTGVEANNKIAPLGATFKYDHVLSPILRRTGYEARATSFPVKKLGHGK